MSRKKGIDGRNLAANVRRPRKAGNWFEGADLSQTSARIWVAQIEVDTSSGRPIVRRPQPDSAP